MSNSKSTRNSHAPEDPTISRIVTSLRNGSKAQATVDETQALWAYLVLDPARPHWYCNEASELLQQVATYCQIWLVSTDKTSEYVVRWESQQSDILSKCVKCVKGMEDALLDSQVT